MIGIGGSIVTIDAVGATENIMEAVHSGGGDFVLQVKKNCSALYAELMALLEGLAEDQKKDEEGFWDRYGGCSRWRLLRGDPIYQM